MTPTVFNTGPNFAFRFQLGFGATGWLLAKVEGETLIIGDVRVEGSENHPNRYKTKSDNPMYQYGIKLGVAKIKMMLRTITDIVKETHPAITHISASRITGAKKMIQVSTFAKLS